MHDPDDKPVVGADAHDTIAPRGRWDGPTYYGRPQLKSAPFDNWVVGGYIFLAGLSGSAMLISGVAEARSGRRAAGMARHGRYLSLLAPTIGAALLVYDLHTPKRFYNMMRIAKKTSPMSIGTWILLAFTGAAFTSAGAQFAADRVGARAVAAADRARGACAGGDRRRWVVQLHGGIVGLHQHTAVGRGTTAAGDAFRCVIGGRGRRFIAVVRARATQSAQPRSDRTCGVERGIHGECRFAPGLSAAWRGRGAGWWLGMGGNAGRQCGGCDGAGGSPRRAPLPSAEKGGEGRATSPRPRYCSAVSCYASPSCQPATAPPTTRRSVFGFLNPRICKNSLVLSFKKEHAYFA